MYFKVTEFEDVGWIHLPQDGALRRNLVNILTLFECCRRWRLCWSAEPMMEECAPLSYKTKYFCSSSLEYLNFFVVYFTILSEMRRLFGVEYENDCVIWIRKYSMWKEAVMACCNIWSENCLKGVKKLKKSMLRNIQGPRQELRSQPPN